MINFKFTPRSTVIFILGLIAASIISSILDNRYVGLAIMVIIVVYLANYEKNNNKKWKPDEKIKKTNNDQP